MRTISPDRCVPDAMTAAEYLEEALDGRWTLDTEYLGNRADMARAWELQNVLRGRAGLPGLTRERLEAACEHFPAA